MKNKIISLLLILTLIIPNFVLADDSSSESSTHDYSEINTLSNDYAYGTLFWSEETEIQKLEDNTSTETLKTHEENGSIDYKYNAAPGKIISVRITKCAVDKNGKLCDVICKITDVKRFNNYRTNDSNEDISNAELSINKYIEYKKRNSESDVDSNLIRFWFSTVSASGHFSMQYVITGTNTPANITKTAASLGDIDVKHTETELEGDLWNGCEGFTLDEAEGEVYYKKNNWLIDTEDIKGVRAPETDYSIGQNSENVPEGVNRITYNDDIDLYNSAVVTENMENATFKLFYSGYGCGILYVFASPYAYQLDNPLKTSSKEEVYEGEKFTYNITQYVPNNYYVDQLNFIENANGKYSDFTITDTLDEHIELDGEVSDIKVVDESNKEVNYFTVTKSNNTITVTAKTEALNNIDFYAHSYTIKIPITIKGVSGTEIKKITNKATTSVKIGESTPETKDSNVKETLIKYKVIFEPKGGTPTPDTQDVLSGNKAEEPTNSVTKNGYTFGGWSTTNPDNSEKQLYDFDSPVNEDITLYAVWTPINYNIEYVLNGGKNDSSNPSTYTVKDVIDFKNPTRDGYDFEGWYLENNFVTPKDGISHETGDKKVYAKWKVKSNTPYKVEHYKESTAGEYELVATEELSGETDSTVTAKTKKYDGYKENTTHKDRIGSGKVLADGSLVLKLYYDKEEYKVTFDPKEGTPDPDDQIVKFNDKATEPKNPTKDGYTFEGWYYKNEKGQEVKYDFSDPVTKNIDLVAKWKTESTTDTDIDTNTNTNIVPKNNDSTLSPYSLPKTGKAKFIVISALCCVALIIGKRYYTLKDI